jgi:hypothetical protein
MVFFNYFKHKQKNLKFAWQHFGTQSLFWVKINLDPIVRLKGLDKSNVHTIYSYNFSTGLGLHVCGSWNITKQKKIEKLMQCPSIKYPLL